MIFYYARGLIGLDFCFVLFRGLNHVPTFDVIKSNYSLIKTLNLKLNLMLRMEFDKKNSQNHLLINMNLIVRITYLNYQISYEFAF